jgi:PTS system D-glucosamine-specific IIC component
MALMYSLNNNLPAVSLEVKDSAKVDDAELKKLGAAGVLKVGQNGVQAIFGSKAQFISNDIKEMM